MLCACTHQGRTLRTQQEGCPLQAKERVLIRNQTTALIWTSFLQSHEKEMSAVWPLLVVLVMQLKLTELGGHTGRGHSDFSRSTEALMLIHHSLSGGHCFQDRAQGQYSWFPFCFLPLGVCSGPFIHALIPSFIHKHLLCTRSWGSSLSMAGSHCPGGQQAGQGGAAPCPQWGWGH